MHQCNDLKPLSSALASFSFERDWDQFHSPKNLAIALSVEASELLELFQWLTESESRNLDRAAHGSAQEELADVFLYLIRLADVLGIDLVAAATEKIKMNEQKYPADRVRGSARKYSEYEGD